MIRWNVLAAGVAVVVGSAFVTGASIPPKRAIEPLKFEARVFSVISQKTGYFNMSAIMRSSRRTQQHLASVTENHQRAAARLKGMRDMYIELQRDVQKTEKPLDKERIGREMLTLSRIIEDFDREHAKTQAANASGIIAVLYDEIRAATEQMAHANGLAVVLAYPGPVTPEEAMNPAVKELLLKPAAAHPFYLDPSLDYTDELLQRLNAKFAAEAGEK